MVNYLSDRRLPCLEDCEVFNQVLELARKARHLTARVGYLPYGADIGLGHLGYGVHVLRYLVGRGALLLGRCGDVVYHVCNGLNAPDYLLEGLSRLVGELHAVVDLEGAFSHRLHGAAGLALYRLYHVAYLFCRLGRALGEPSYLVGDHGKAAAPPSRAAAPPRRAPGRAGGL